MDSKESKLKPWIVKKRAKFTNILKTQYNITASNLPEINIVWCNGGLATGISKEEIVKYFSKFGVIESLAVISGKSYCFIEYKEIKSAITCYNVSQNQYLIPDKYGPMCLLYADSIPDHVPSHSFLPPGCTLFKEFLSPEEELNLLDYVDYKNNNDWFSLKQRKVKHFGYEFVYAENCAKKFDYTKEMPLLCDYFWNRIKNLGYPLPYIPDQLTVNCYDPGQGIPPHVDTHSVFDHEIYIVSLKSDIQMEFKIGNDHTCVHVPRRSLLILSDAARYAWSHGISSRTSDVYFIDNLGYVAIDRGTRVSFTFRRLRENPCDCNFPQHCDSRITDSTNLEDDCAVEIENQFVNEIYNNIADHFSLTRYKPWPHVLNFITSFPVGSWILDVGCGNGKYFGYNKNIFEQGCELCPSLAQICKENGYETINSNCLTLPFLDNLFDGIICIAVIHHLCTLNRRLRAVSEILRVLRRRGKALLYVWADLQVDPNATTELDELQHGNLPINPSNVKLNSKVTLPVVANDGQNFQRKDILVPWTHNKENKTFLRYYHIFEEEELKKLLLSSGGDIIRVYHDTGNWCIEFTK